MAIITINDTTPIEEIQQIIDSSEPFDTLLFSGTFYLKETLRLKAEGRQYIGQQRTAFYNDSEGKSESNAAISIGKGRRLTFGGIVQIADIRDAMPSWARWIYDLCRGEWMRRGFLWLFRGRSWTQGCTIHGFEFRGKHSVSTQIRVKGDSDKDLQWILAEIKNYIERAAQPGDAIRRLKRVVDALAEEDDDEQQDPTT